MPNFVYKNSSHEVTKMISLTVIQSSHKQTNKIINSLIKTDNLIWFLVAIAWFFNFHHKIKKFFMYGNPLNKKHISAFILNLKFTVFHSIFDYHIIGGAKVLNYLFVTRTLRKNTFLGQIRLKSEEIKTKF